MTMRPFKAALRREPGGVVIDLHGEIDKGADEPLNAAYAAALRSDPPVVLLNFAGVDYINSTGIALIVGLLAHARKSGRRMLACNLSDHYQTIFHITRLADFVSIFPDEASALAGPATQAARGQERSDQWLTRG